MSVCADSEARAPHPPRGDSPIVSDDPPSPGRDPRLAFQQLILACGSPLLVFITKDSLVVHARRDPDAKETLTEKPLWLQVSYSLPVPQSLITNAWSAGPRLLVLLGSSLNPFQPGRLSLWNPLSGSLSRLPSFDSIWHLITLGYGDNMVVAVGFDRDIRCVIEIVHIDQASPVWHTVGQLPLSFNVGEHDEILYCRGAFYVLCMESSMLVIDPHNNRFVLHDIPCPSAPKLISSCDSIFMVEGRQFSRKLELWQFDSEQGNWHAKLIECLFVRDSPSEITSVKGTRTSIYFVLSGLSILEYDLLNCVWHSSANWSARAIVRPIMWEPSI